MHKQAGYHFLCITDHDVYTDFQETLNIETWGIRNRTVYVECSGVERVNFIVGGNVGDGRTVTSDHGENTLHYAAYPLRGSETYVRIECVDASGKKAWTNPIFLKD